MRVREKKIDQTILIISTFIFRSLYLRRDKKEKGLKSEKEEEEEALIKCPGFKETRLIHGYTSH